LLVFLSLMFCETALITSEYVHFPIFKGIACNLQPRPLIRGLFGTQLEH